MTIKSCTAQSVFQDEEKHVPYTLSDQNHAARSKTLTSLQCHLCHHSDSYQVVKTGPSLLWLL